MKRVSLVINGIRIAVKYKVGRLGFIGWTLVVLIAGSSIVQAEFEGTAFSSYFSAGYQEARSKFLDAAKLNAAHIVSYKCPVNGPEGDTLYLDVALLGSTHAKTIVVLGSGTHGVEGFAGSGIQVGLLEERLGSRLGEDTAFLMIHAINPYGFAHLRRVNENNVDLNRNFIDHAQPYPQNAGYEELAEAISPASMSLWSSIKAYLQFLLYRVENGEQKLREAISQGQYSHPQGLFYGGRSEEWSNTIIQRIAHHYLAEAEKVVVIDIHTGLGQYGHAEIILNVPRESQAYQRAVGWWGKRVKTTVRGDSVSVDIQGSLKLALPLMLPGVEVTAVSLEFGTFPRKEVFQALRSENRLHHQGGGNIPDKKKVKEKLLRVFYPNTDDWNLQVWRQGKEVVEQLLGRLQ